MERRRRSREVRREAALLIVVLGAAASVMALLFGLVGIVSMLVAGLVIVVLRPRVPVVWLLWMYGAEPLPWRAAPDLHHMVDVLAARAGLPERPDVFYVGSPIANAFVIGRSDGAVLVVSDGLLRVLSRRQLAGVLAHEVSHLRDGDTAVMNLCDLMTRFAQALGWFGWASFLVTVPVALLSGEPRRLLLSVLLVLLPSLVGLTQLAMFRRAEYAADQGAASLTGDPESLAEALVTLERIEGRIWERLLVGQARPPDPLLLRTHPRTEERVRRLLALESPPRPRGPSRTSPAGSWVVRRAREE
jgi:heat shock protein HtpX